MNFDTTIKVAVYTATAETGTPPSAAMVAERVGTAFREVKEAFRRVRADRLLLLDAHGETIRMAPGQGTLPLRAGHGAAGAVRFRSEELVAAWCEDRGVAPRPIVRMDQLRQLAVTWYATRLDADSRRPKPAETRGICARIGLEGDFWDPQADTFA